MANSSTESPSPRHGPRRLPRVLAIALGVIVVLLLAAGLGLRWQLGRSLPRLDGEITLAGLTAAVEIERDALGVPTIRGAGRADVARGLGFVHGQDRFFQMDLIRRQAAGELAELVGAAALPVDRKVRVHRFRARARGIVEALEAGERRLLDAYTQGVNAGLASLAAPPFEYLVLRTEPAPWRGEDTFLALYAMYLDLQGGAARRESAYGLVHDLLPPALYEFLTPRGTEWDAPIDDGEPFAAPPMPSPADFDLRDEPPTEWQVASRRSAEASTLPWDRPRRPEFAVGSNNWAVAGSHTRGDGALLANDMHLGHSVPNIWYRASLVFPDPGDPGQDRRVTGVTLPGGMMIVAGSNGEVAWGFTNTQADWADLVELEIDPDDPDVYHTPDGPERFERHQEQLRANDAPGETLEVVETIWGPVWDVDHQGRQRALAWVAHRPPAANLGLLKLETASDVEEAIAVAQQIGSPAQNFVTADSGGRIGWTVMGPVPRRFGHDGRLPSSWADGSRGWDGWLWPEEVPQVTGPPAGRIWTANARVVSGERYARLGDGGYDVGARAGQIRDRLLALEQATEADLLAIQLDDRALFLERWRRLLLEVLSPEATAGDARRAELRRLLDDWDGRAGTDSAAYRLVRAFRLELRDQVFASLTAACLAADGDFRYTRLGQKEGPLWHLASERPPHLLAPRFDDWQEQFLAAVDAVVDELLANGGELADKTWGARNRVSIRHPLSRFLPFASRWLDMPARELPGDANMPRFQSPGAGASERMVVSPGREENGIFHMPTGQSGHPLSPHYRDGQRAWEDGEPTGFLPGPAAHTLTLTPADGSTPRPAHDPAEHGAAGGPEPAKTADSAEDHGSEDDGVEDHGFAEATSLLGRPLAAPILPEEFRREQEALLSAAEADLEQRPEDPEALIWVGRRSAYLGHYREAVQIYGHGLADHPDHPDLLRHRGHRYITLRRLDDAVADLERASELIDGIPDRVEEDGLPNARGIPTSTSHSNIWYHLGLAHYLKGDFERARAAYQSCLTFSQNPDMLSATSYWLYMTLRRLGLESEARRVLEAIEPDMDIIENHSYHRLLMMYQGREGPVPVLAEAEQAGGAEYATVGYGVGNFYLAAGKSERAREIFENIVATDAWAAFGYIAAEAELARMKSQEQP